ncbi:MAG: hypothetical protein ABSE99_02655 [Terracidiphilus sp.]|jgi:hypothetical protein
MSKEKSGSLRNLRFPSIQLEKMRERFPWRVGAIALLAGFGIMGLDYLIHPQAARFQNQVVQELRSLPLPSDATEQGFTSGYQPEKGRASRTIAFGRSAKDLCAFYSDIMTESGWQLVQEECYPSSAGHALIVFRRGQVTFKIVSGKQDI